MKVAITGAYSYSGKYIARRLLDEGHQVITLTGHPDRPDPFDGKVKAHPFNFELPEALTETLRGVDVLVNTYWVRYAHGGTTYDLAVANTRTLIAAAVKAGVRRMVHTSILNPDPESRLPYYAGKGKLEADIRSSGLGYTILRPTVIFGREDVLINNITWFLRHFPVFGIPGDGTYKLQPIFVEDLAELAVVGVLSQDSTVVDAIGPETYTFNDLVAMLKKTVDSRTLVMHLPPMMAYAASRLAGLLVGDMVLTREEVDGLLDDLLVTNSPPAGKTRLSEWAAANAGWLGKNYAHEIRRHFGR
ncbi:MAG: NAD-dependent epimerase/dehydratase family protein [Anaerolineae bacterium]|nr:MAG: NAD-dependent epimerase/dehydratase family protein [Anaerolineae bacterium]